MILCFVQKKRPSLILNREFQTLRPNDGFVSSISVETSMVLTFL